MFIGFLNGLLFGAAGVVAYDLVTGYSVADFFKDLAVSLFNKSKTFAQAKAARLEAALAKMKK
jgi:hypothetical protein